MPDPAIEPPFDSPAQARADLIMMRERFEQCKDVYEQGYRDGESNVAADWHNALDDVLPEGVEAQPTQVAAYIERLQASHG